MRMNVGKDYQMKFEGGDSEDEQLIFKSAALGAGAKGKHVVELSAVDVKPTIQILIWIYKRISPYYNFNY